MGRLARAVSIIGVGMTPFGRFPAWSIKDLAREASWLAIRDAGVDARKIQAVYCGNSVEGLLSGQEDVRGQVVMREAGLAGRPIVNTPNACASSSTALREAWLAVASGLYDLVLAVGFEKLYVDDTARTTRALASCTDVAVEGNLGVFFPGLYALEAKRYMLETGCTQELFARVSVKNHRNGRLNPKAQIQKAVTLEEVLASKTVAWPITLYMCSPIGDGGAAAVVCAADLARRYRSDPVAIAAIGMASGGYQELAIDREKPTATALASAEAYEISGLGPEDVDLIELHGAFSPAEFIYFEQLGFAAKGEAPRYLETGETEITGRIPVNPSGGLESKGHPVGATGLAMVYEIVIQLRGQAGPRQVKDPKVGLVHNGGGLIGGDAAVMCVHILKR
ncbi:MAG: thiolase family protein [Thermodesulfobacteriota bacterium]